MCEGKRKNEGRRKKIEMKNFYFSFLFMFQWCCDDFVSICWCRNVVFEMIHAVLIFFSWWFVPRIWNIRSFNSEKFSQFFKKWWKRLKEMTIKHLKYFSKTPSGLRTSYRCMAILWGWRVRITSFKEFLRLKTPSACLSSGLSGNTSKIIRTIII